MSAGQIFVPIVFRGPNGAATGVGAQYSPVWFLHAVTCTHHLVPGYSGLPAFQNGDFQMFSIMYPAIIPGLSSLQNQEQTNRGAGIYVVPVLPFMG
ncbi:hypothetical protein CRYUN_Cryun13aG0062800 [Craigia yunnanensis]